MEGMLLTTTFSGEKKQEKRQAVVFQAEQTSVENQVVNLYPEITYETLEGFGGAVTEAAAYLYSLMNDRQKKQVIDTYFKEETMNYRLIRVHMDSCDFSLGQYEAMSDPKDRELESFSMERTEKYIFPMLEDIRKAADHPLSLMLSPWSPPAFMKENGRREAGGKLKKEYRQFWAEYLCRYMKEFQKRGYQVERISVQNEPNAVQSWDSCVYTGAEEKEFLRDFLYPTMVKEGLGNVEIFIWDHNKERVFDRAREIIDDQTDSMVAGLAFHWYSGDHFEALQLVREQFPNKKLVLSESCLEYNKFSKDDFLKNSQRLAHEMIGDLNHGMTAFYDWNLLLDEKGGPNYVNNYCHAPFLYDTRSKELLVQSTQPYFRHFTHYLLPGSVRIAYTKYTANLELTAWKRPDGKLAIVLLNAGKEKCPAVLRLQGKMATISLAPESISTCILEA